jgi:quinoprotein glucose dehydrogenase
MLRLSRQQGFWLRTAKAAILLSPTLPLSVSSTLAQESSRAKPYTGWSDYMGGPQSMQYSALNQINRDTVKDLDVAWTFNTDDQISYNFTPVVAHGVVYLMAQNASIVAVDGATGKQLWSHPTTQIRYRGLNYWESEDGKEGRIFYPDNNYLFALDARTGEQIMSFGVGGRVDLKAGLGRDTNSIPRIQSSSPGRVFENLIIMGSGTGERLDSPPGDIRAYDVHTGKVVWQFHTIPHKGEPGYETWPAGAADVAGNANVWGEMSVDPKRGVLYASLGATGYNFYGGEREGKNLFGDCIVAINARTGKLLWYYQLVHHNIWDLDSPSAPKPLTINHDGKKQDVLAEATKMGWIFVFDRDTGKPIWPIEEVAVPQSTSGQEHTYPTQPFPSKPEPFAVQNFTQNDINPYMDKDELEYWTRIVKNARNDQVKGTDTYTPLEVGKDSISVPGNHGGANWGMVAADPTNGTLYVETLNLPSILKLVTTLPPTGTPTDPAVIGQGIVTTRCALCHGPRLEGNPPSIPSLVGVVDRLGVDGVKTSVREGRGSMPSFADLSPSEIDSVTAYLKAPEMVSPVPPEPPAPAGVTLSSTTPNGTRYYSGFGFFFPRNGSSIMRPPWVTLTAYDLNTGNKMWQIPVGDDPTLAKQGIHNTGAGGIGATGAITVAGGMVFIGNTRDQVFRAVDTRDGKVIWDYQLPLISGGAPTIYEVNGKEYILLSVSTNPAGRTAPTTILRRYMAFALRSAK